MSLGWSAAALLATAASAVACYAGSPNCRWRRWRGGAAAWCGGWALAVVALALWIAALGVGAGVSVMLGSWGLFAAALPYLALRVPAETREPR